VGCVCRGDCFPGSYTGPLYYIDVDLASSLCSKPLDNFIIRKIWTFASLNLPITHSLIHKIVHCKAKTTTSFSLNWTLHPGLETAHHKQGHTALSGPVDSMHFVKCICFILWTLTVLSWISPLGTCQNSVYFPILWLDFVKFTACFPLPRSQAAAAGSFFGSYFQRRCVNWQKKQESRENRKTPYINTNIPHPTHNLA